MILLFRFLKKILVREPFQNKQIVKNHFNMKFVNLKKYKIRFSIGINQILLNLPKKENCQKTYLYH